MSRITALEEAVKSTQSALTDTYELMRQYGVAIESDGGVSIETYDTIYELFAEKRRLKMRLTFLQDKLDDARQELEDTVFHDKWRQTYISVPVPAPGTTVTVTIAVAKN
jgi:hypothetical protein